MKTFVIITVVLHLVRSASIADIKCPDSCTCHAINDYLETSCTSYEFIKKLYPKQESIIVRLNLVNASLENVDLKLKYLKNLHALNLSRNQIRTLPIEFPYLPKLELLNLSCNSLNSIEFSHLPKNLQVIDLSNNNIQNFPREWSSLEKLKILHFYNNPINCDCDNLAVYDQLIKKNIQISGNLICFYPKEFYGQQLNTVNCSVIKENFLNSMLGDEAGSGLHDSETQNEFNSFGEEGEELLNAEGVSIRKEEEEEEEEGSGDEGSGFIPIIPLHEKPKACYFNCSTPRPIGIHDEKDASPLPSVQEQANILFEDILQPEKVVPVSAAPEETKQVLEVKEGATDFNETDSDKADYNGDVVTFISNDTVVGEMERASFENSNIKNVYIIIALVVIFIVFLAIYVFQKKKNQKKRNSRKRNKTNENGFGEEMKPLGKSAENVKPVEKLNSKLPESTPLLNGQNGKVTEDGNLKSRDEENDDLENVELRKSEKDETLTPQPERVTIIAGELPDSIPKTPLLVHRQLNSDGKIVTTAVNSN